MGATETSSASLGCWHQLEGAGGLVVTCRIEKSVIFSGLLYYGLLVVHVRKQFIIILLLWLYSQLCEEGDAVALS